MTRTLLLALGLAALCAGAAQAHARLLRADPRVGSTVAAPQALRLFFSETIVPARSSVALSGPGGKPAPLGGIGLDPKDPRVVVVPVTARLAPGAYHVAWRMHTPDTHTTEGDFVFKVKP